MKILFWKVWDYLTHTTYRVKIKKYDDGTQWCYPQQSSRIFPVWRNIVDCSVYGSVHRYRSEIIAWSTIHGLITSRPPRVNEIEVKYKE